MVAVALSNFNCINFAKIPETEKIGTFEIILVRFVGVLVNF